MCSCTYLRIFIESFVHAFGAVVERCGRQTWSFALAMCVCVRCCFLPRLLLLLPLHTLALFLLICCVASLFFYTYIYIYFIYNRALTRLRLRSVHQTEEENDSGSLVMGSHRGELVGGRVSDNVL